MYVAGRWVPSDDRLLVDSRNPKLMSTVTKDQFFSVIERIDGIEAVVLWDRDVSPRLDFDDAPWSIHDGAPQDPDNDPAFALLHACTRVYLRRGAAMYHRRQKRWWWISSSANEPRVPPGASDLLRMVRSWEFEALSQVDR